MYAALRSLYLTVDKLRSPGGPDRYILTEAQFRILIEAAAKWEGRESEQYPFETGAEHAARTSITPGMRGS